MLTDAALVAFAYYIVLNLRFDWHIPEFPLPGFILFLLIAVGVHLLANRLAGVDAVMSRYVGGGQALRLVQASLASTAALLVVVVAWPDQRLVPLSVVLMGGLVTMLFMVAVRFCRRIFHERSLSNAQSAL